MMGTMEAYSNVGHTKEDIKFRNVNVLKAFGLSFNATQHNIGFKYFCTYEDGSLVKGQIRLPSQRMKDT